MKPTIVGASCCLVVLLTAPHLTSAQSSDFVGLKSAREFVQGFYAWYVPIASGDTKLTPSDIALNKRRSAFSDELFQRLKEDSNAQSHCNEIVGIDFDPFLNGQDVAQRYEIGEIKWDGRTYRANVYGIWYGVKDKQSDVVPEFVQSKGRWYFVNFHYPDIGTDLLAILAIPPSPCTVPS